MSHPPATPKPAPRRTALRAAVCAFGLAAVLVSAIGPPAQEPTAEAASHEARPNGSIWVSTAVVASATTWEWTHTNLWRCDARLGCDDSAGIGPPSAVRGATTSTTCDPLPRAATAGAAYSAGCGGHKPGSSGWKFTGHDTANTGQRVDGSALYSCPTETHPISDPAECGDWQACGSNRVPNAAKTACRPCPSGQQPTLDGEDCETPTCPTGQHRHGAGACQADHPPRVGPDCATGLTSDVTVTWTYHDNSGNDVQGSKICGPSGGGGGGGGGGGPDGSVCAARQTQVWPYGKRWTYPYAIRYVSTGVPTPGNRVQTPTPLSVRHGHVWAPRVLPSNGASIARSGAPTLNVEAWLGLDFTGEDRFVYWQYHGANSVQARAQTYYNGFFVRCATVVVRHAGAGWRLVNLALADEEAATSGTGRGRRSFELAAQPVPDPSKPSGFSAYDAWDVWVEFTAARGTPWPGCHHASWFIHTTSSTSGATARLGVTSGWRPYAATDSRHQQSCGWTVKRWTAIPVEVTDCPDTPAHDHDPGGDEPFGPGDTAKGPHRHCAMPGV